MRVQFLVAAFTLTLSACEVNLLGNPPPDSAFYNRGGPEQLLDTSSEVVNLSVANGAANKALSAWVTQDKPSRAELYCKATDANCIEAKKVLELQRIPVMPVASQENTVALVYERLVARDCDQRYRDSGQDWHFKNAPESGCSVAANIVQHVSDKRQFVNPALMDNPRATGPVNTYINAVTGQARQQQQQQPFTLEQSTLGQASTSSQ